MQHLTQEHTLFSAAISWPRRPLGLWLGLNMLDALLTFYLLGLGGTEGNPMLGFVQAQVGAGSMLIAKLAFASAAGVAMWSRGRSDLLRIAGGLMGLVVAYNLALAIAAQPFAF